MGLSSLSLGLLFGLVSPLVLPETRQTPANIPVSRPGSLEKRMVRYYIQLQEPAVRNCYVRELGKRPALSTSVTVEMEIDATGRVSRCDTGNSTLHRCVSLAICTIRFPYVFDLLTDGSRRISETTTQVRYRYQLRPRKRKKYEATGASQRDLPVPELVQKLKAPPPQQPPPAGPRQGPAGAAPAAPRLPIIKQPRSNDPLEGILRRLGI